MTKADYVCEDNPKASQLVGMPCDLIPLVQYALGLRSNDGCPQFELAQTLVAQTLAEV